MSGEQEKGSSLPIMNDAKSAMPRQPIPKVILASDWSLVLILSSHWSGHDCTQRPISTSSIPATQSQVHPDSNFFGLYNYVSVFEHSARPESASQQ